MNTLITYQYRDAANYKEFDTVIIHGQLSLSDIDILVEFEEDHIPGLITFCGMQNELSDMICREIDLRTPQDLSRYFRDEVVETALVQYEQR